MARRDAYFERAMEFLNLPTNQMETSTRVDNVGKVLALMKTCVRHAGFAVKSPQATRQEHDFLHFLNLIANNVQSAQSMLEHQVHFEVEEGFLCQFLNARPEACALPAMHYRRRADDIFQGLWQILRLAHKPYRDMQQGNLAGMNDSERERYHRAYDFARRELEERFKPAA